MSATKKSLRKKVTSESALFLILLLVGLLFLPIVIYLVGTSVFGEYAGNGFWNFLGLLHSKLWAGEPVVWFLVLSPYIIWQIFRMTIRLFRHPRAAN